MNFSNSKKDGVATAYPAELHELVRAYRYGGHQRVQSLISEIRNRKFNETVPLENVISKSDQNCLIDLAKDIAAYLVLLDAQTTPEQVLNRQMKEGI
jgi:hypothetical protein